MKKTIIRITSLFLVALSLVILTGCNNSDQKSYVTIETNPAVEMVVDANNKVVSINGTNEDGKLLLSGEVIVGMNADDATEKVLSLTVELGFIVEGDDKDDAKVNVSVTGSVVEEAEKLAASLKSTVDNVIEEYDLAATVELLETKSKAHFEKIAMAYDPTLTAEEASAMSMAELLDVVNLATLEKAEFVSVKLEEYYQELKAQEFQLAYKQSLADSLDSAYAAIKTNYLNLLTSLQNAINNLKAKKVELLTSSDSLYVKALEAYNSAKDEVLDIRVEISVKTKKGESTTTSQITLSSKEFALSAAEATLKAAEQTIEGTFDTLVAILEGVYTQLEALEAQFPETIDFEAKLTEAENKINASKDELFTKFEESFTKAKLDEIKNDISTRKAALKTQVESSKNN